MNDVIDVLKSLDLRSTTIGFGAGLVVSLGLLITMKVGKLMLKLALAAVIFALFGGAFFGAR